MTREGELISQDGLQTAAVTYHTGSQALFSTILASRTEDRPSEAVVESVRKADIEPWGELNDFPQQVIKDIEQNALVDTVLDRKATRLVGDGIIFGNYIDGPGGMRIIEPLDAPDIDRWLRRTNVDLYSVEAAKNFFTFYNTNAEFVRKRSGEVTRLASQDQSWLRLGTNDERGCIKKAYLNADWKQHFDATSKYTINLEALDPYYDVVGQIEQSKKLRHLMPIRLQEKGRKYYALAPWNGLRNSGWFELSIAIPKMKLRLIQNMMSIKYWIEISTEYWPLRFGKTQWDKWTIEERRKKMKEEIDSFTETFAGEDEIGKPKSLTTPMMQGRHSDDLISMWKVTELKNHINEGAYIEDSQETDFYLVRGLGEDPVLSGISPGKSSSSPGSGSDARVRRTNWLMDNRVYGNMITRPIEIAFEVNEFDKKYNNGRPIHVMFRSLHAATLDRTTQVSGSAPNPTTPEDGSVQNNG